MTDLPPPDNDPGPVPEPMAPDTDEPVRSTKANVAVRGTPAINHDEIRRALEERQAVAEKVEEGPARSARKDEWEKHAESLGIDTEGKTKDELIEAVNDVAEAHDADTGADEDAD